MSLLSRCRDRIANSFAPRPLVCLSNVWTRSVANSSAKSPPTSCLDLCRSVFAKSPSKSPRRRIVWGKGDLEKANTDLALFSFAHFFSGGRDSRGVDLAGANTDFSLPSSRVLPCSHVPVIPFSRWQGVWWHSRWAAHSRGTAFGNRLHTLWRCCRARAARPSRPPW